VLVENQHGSVRLPIEITDGLMPGTVLAPGVWWAKSSPDGRNINQVVSQEEADMGAGALFYDTLVRVTRTEGQATAFAQAELAMR
jgi:anaerobic selenocysteine-containing dehydrogenase